MKNLVFAVLLFISGIAAAVSISSAVADTYAPVEVPCPLGGRNARGVEIMSQSFFDRLLDGEPVGAHGEPNPPPECPDNGFLVYKKYFSESELSQIKEYIFSEAYQSLWHQDAPSFYRLAKTLEYQEIPMEDYYHYYLLALWEIPDRADSLYRDYVRETIPAYLEALKTLEGKVGPFIGQKIEAYMGLAEFYRRIGNFEKAQEYLDQVIEDDADLKFIHHSYVDYMGYLISKKDSDAHMISESQKTP